MPFSLVDLKKLEFLSLESNRLSDLGKKSLVNLTSLNTLLLGWNRIEYIATIKPHLRCLPRLEKIYLNDNKIRLIAANAFGLNSHLKSINLNSNPIRTVHAAVFESLLSLETFKMANTSLSTFNLSWIKSANVSKLELSFNNLTSAPGFCFKFLNGFRMANIHLMDNNSADRLG